MKTLFFTLFAGILMTLGFSSCLPVRQAGAPRAVVVAPAPRPAVVVRPAVPARAAVVRPRRRRACRRRPVVGIRF